MRNNLMKCSTLAVLALTMIVGAVGVGDARAQVTQPPDPQYPFFGAGAGQIFRFQVAAGNTTCHATLSFADTMNMPLRVPPDPVRDAVPIQKEVYLGPHKSAFLDLDPRLLGVAFGQRINFRPVLMYDRDTDSGLCLASFEVYEPRSGRTLAMAHPPDPGAPVGAPIPDDGFPVGLAFGQTLVLAVSRVTEPPPLGKVIPLCNAELHLHAADGSIVASMLTGELMPGFAAFLSLNAGKLGLSFGQRAGIAPCILPIRGINDGCKVSVHVLDTLSMWTTGMAGVN